MSEAGARRNDLGCQTEQDRVDIITEIHPHFFC